jgi:glycosyl transferase family 25
MRAPSKNDSPSMEIMVINLKRSVGRRARMTVLMKRLGLEYSFSEAIDGTSGEHLASSNYEPLLAVRAQGQELTPSEVACFASHYRLWWRCTETGLPLVIMEDDVALHPKFKLALALARRVVDDFGFVRLEGIFRRSFNQLHSVEGFDVVRFRRGPSGSAAYAVSAEGAQTLIDHAWKWRYPVDLYLDRFWEHGLSSIAIIPYPARQITEQVRGHYFPTSLRSERAARPQPEKPCIRLRLARWIDEQRRRAHLFKQWMVGP